MFPSLVASQSPTVQEFGAPSPAPAPAPPAPAPAGAPPMPGPAPEPRQAFSVVAVPDLFCIVGTFVPSSTVATATCDDAAPLLHVSQQVPGLTFSIAGKVVRVEGTPAAPADLHRVVLSFLASDGSLATLGACTLHVQVVDASEVLTVGAMGNATGKVGYPASASLVTVTTNYGVQVTAVARLTIEGLSWVFNWTRGTSSGSGTMQMTGTPVQAGTYEAGFDYYARGRLVGSSTHTVQIVAAHEPLPAPPAAAPAPSPPAIVAPPAPVAVVAAETGPDALWGSTVTLARFDDEGSGEFVQDLAAGLDWVNEGAEVVPGLTGTAARFSTAATRVVRSAPDLQIVTPADESLTVDVMVKFAADSALWSMRPGRRTLFVPVVHAANRGGALLWALGLKLWSRFTPFGVEDAVVIEPVFLMGGAGFIQAYAPDAVTGENTLLQIDAQMQEATGLPIAFAPGRYCHMRGLFAAFSGNRKQAVWFDGIAPANCFVGLNYMDRPDPANCQIQVGGTCDVPGRSLSPRAFGVLRPDGRVGRYDEVLPLVADVDELRITKAGRNTAFLTGLTGQSNLPESARTPPWRNY